MAAEAGKRQGLRLPRLSFYVLRQLIGPIALFALLMTSVIWLTQSLRLLDLVINRGQSAPTFLYLSLLILPSLLLIILPIALYTGSLYALSRLNGESELVVMSAAGYSRWQLAVPLFVAAAIVMALTYICGLWLMPAGQHAMADKVLDIRADIGAALLNEGEFNTPAKGLTVFIRELDNDGHIHGVLVHDNRNRARPITYLAESGALVQTPSGARLVMFDGTVEQSGAGGRQLSVLNFKSYVFNLDQFGSPSRASLRSTSERYLSELLWPPNAPGLSEKIRNSYFAEAHSRLSQPLYCIAFVLIALAAISRGRRQRGTTMLRYAVATICVVLLRIAGYGVQGLAARNPPLVALFYIIPLGGAAAAYASLRGLRPLSWLLRPARLEAAQ